MVCGHKVCVNRRRSGPQDMIICRCCDVFPEAQWTLNEWQEVPGWDPRGTPNARTIRVKESTTIEGKDYEREGFYMSTAESTQGQAAPSQATVPPPQAGGFFDYEVQGTSE